MYRLQDCNGSEVQQRSKRQCEWAKGEHQCWAGAGVEGTGTGWAGAGRPGQKVSSRGSLCVDEGRGHYSPLNPSLRLTLFTFRHTLEPALKPVCLYLMHCSIACSLPCDTPLRRSGAQEKCGEAAGGAAYTASGGGRGVGGGCS